MGRRAPGSSTPPTGRSRRRPSSRWRPRGRCAGSSRREVAGLGYELILGNTYHLFVSPGPERIAAAGGLHGFMGWERALITDSGGFQVFSLAHGGVADEVKGSGRPGGEHGSVISIEEEGVRFRSYRDGTELFISPEVSMQVQAALGSDIALVFDECTPYHADRDYTARSMERTHRWLDRCLDWHAAERARAPGGLRHRPGRRPRGAAPRVGAGGLRGRRRRDRDRRHPGARQGGDGRGAGDDRAAAARRGAQAPARDRRGRRPARRDRPRPRRLRLRRADPARPPRRRPRPRPREPLPHRPAQGRLGGGPRAAGRGLPLPRLPQPRPRLPQLPLAGGGADRGPPALPPQPHLHARAGRRRARRAIVRPGRSSDYRAGILGGGGSPWVA